MTKRIVVSSLVLTLVVVGGRFVSGSGSGAVVPAAVVAAAATAAAPVAPAGAGPAIGAPQAALAVADTPELNAPSATGFAAASPARLMDTRPRTATVDGQAAGAGAVAVGATVEVVVAGRGGVPGSATAVALNVTSTGAGAAGFLTVWPCGQARPLASSLNFSAGSDVANAVLTKVGADGKVCVYAGAAATHLVVDVTGWYPAGAEYAAATPSRLLDTRPGATTTDGQAAGAGVVGVGATVELQVTGRGSVPAGASAVALNVTSTGAGGNGFLTVWPCGEARPLASSLNFSAGRDAANTVLTKLGGGKVCVYAGAAPTHVVVDVTGWYPAVAEFRATTPARLADTRAGAATVDGRDGGGGPLAAGQEMQLLVTERGGVPVDAFAVVLNVTVTGAAGNGFLTVYPCGETRPLASNVNFSAGRDVANAVFAKVGADDRVCVYAGAAATHLVVDVAGWFPGGTSTGGGVTGNPPPPVGTPLPPIQAGQWQRVTPPGITLGTGPDDFGMQAMASSASDPRVVYVGTSYHGIWRTSDAGTTWTKVNTGSNGANLETGRNWAMAVDPTNSDVLYTAAGYGNGQGLWKSVNGGRDWQQMMSANLLSTTTADIYSIAINPADARHVLVSFHGPWGGNNSAAGLIESLDHGATWRIVPAGGNWGWGHYVYFVDTNTWILGTQDDGHWRTTNRGASWTKVTNQNMTHGGGDLHRVANGVLYLGANNTVMRSTDNGASWSDVAIPRVQDGFYSIVSDGTRMYTQSGNTGGNTLDPDPPPYSSLESDGQTWAPLNGGAGPYPENGAFYAVYDPANRIILSSNWLAGVWRYKVP